MALYCTGQLECVIIKYGWETNTNKHYKTPVTPIPVRSRTGGRGGGGVREVMVRMAGWINTVLLLCEDSRYYE